MAAQPAAFDGSDNPAQITRYAAFPLNRARRRKQVAVGGSPTADETDIAAIAWRQSPRSNGLNSPPH
jgi:hypothetical protein